MAEEKAAGTREWAELWLSKERLAPYLAACGGDADLAVELHEWNVSLAQVLMRDVAHLEVAMRNAYDRVLSDAWGGEGHWLLDDASPVRNRVAHDERLFDPKWPELSPLRADADAVRLFRDLCPEAASRVLGDSDATPVERFLAESPAPSEVRL